MGDRSLTGLNTMRLTRNDKSLASKLVKYPNQLPLSAHVAPTYSGSEEPIKVPTRMGDTAGKLGQSGNGGILKKTNMGCIIQDNLEFAAQLNTATLTSSEAEQLSYPYSVPAYAMDTIANTTLHRLAETRGRITWAAVPNVKQILPSVYNGPPKASGKDKKGSEEGEPSPCKWPNDLRFIGDWWICLEKQSLDQIDPTLPRHEPLYVPSGKWNSKGEENEFLLELIKQLIYGRRYFLELIHIDNFPLTAERLHVFFFNGLLDILEHSFLPFEQQCIIANRHLYGWQTDGTQVGENVYAALDDRREKGKLSEDSILHLATLSFSICQINTAALFVLLVALSSPKSGHLITTLDVSFNQLDGNSFFTLSQLIPLTHIRRLSLRGNALTNESTTSFREFLLESSGTAADEDKITLMELDLSFTQLSYKQICVLLECLPQAKSLRYLLLDGLNIPVEKISALREVISSSNLFSVSLQSIPEISDNKILMDEIAEICASNRLRCQKDGKHKEEGFFQDFFAQLSEKGLRAPQYSALPDGYSAFKNNDPSLCHYH